MKVNFLFVSVSTLMSLLLGLDFASADLLCAKKSVKPNPRSGAVAFAGSLKVVSGPSCPGGYKSILDTAVFVGPQGVDGVDGVDGTFDPSKCFKRESSAGGSGIVSVTTACLVSEVIAATGCTTNSPSGYVREQTLSNGDNSQYKDLYGLFTCVIEDLNNSFHTVTAQAMCCRP